MRGILLRHKAMVGFGRLRLVLTLLIDDSDGLAISIYEDNITAGFGFKPDQNCEKLGEVEVPAELVEVARNFAVASLDLHERKELIHQLMEG